MSTQLVVEVKSRPVLDPGYLPAVLHGRAYRALVDAEPASRPLRIGVGRADGTVFIDEIRVLPPREEHRELNLQYVERRLKTLLWQKGGSRIYIGGAEEIAAGIAELYRPGGRQAFDHDIVGRKMFLEEMTVESRSLDGMPTPRETTRPLGRNLDGCRIGFDLGGSDRKSAALIDGKVVFSEEIDWDPYFEKDPQYHYDGINDSLRRAAAHLPRVDAIGGSAAGVYVDNEARVGSLFRGVSDEDFDKHVRRIFFRLKEEWGGIPFEVANDGEVTALAASMSLGDNAVLGVSMGTSQAAGYCNPDGYITSWLNELAFVPVDYRVDAPQDEWSKDIGCGVQYFSQQGVGRLTTVAGIELPADLPLPEKLVEVQRLMAAGDERARRIYETIGTYFGYAIALYAELYEIRNLLILGRVTSGEGGELIIATAEGLLRSEFPELAEKITLRTPSEQDKRHGQAIAAASLPRLV